MTKVVTHDISERMSPVSVIVMCTCGWSRQFTRRQNAWARASKVRAAIAAHEADVEKKEAKDEDAS